MSIKRKIQRQKVDTSLKTKKNEEAMIAGIIEGSPDAVGVVVIRIDCGCRKMAAVDIEGEPASKVIMYRDEAESICEKCKDDDGAFIRAKEQFIHWDKDDIDNETKTMIYKKVIGTTQIH